MILRTPENARYGAYHSSSEETQAGGPLGSDIQYSLFGKLQANENLVSKAVDGVAGDDIRDCPLPTSHASVRASS